MSDKEAFEAGQKSHLIPRDRMDVTCPKCHTYHALDKCPRTIAGEALGERRERLTPTGPRWAGDDGTQDRDPHAEMKPTQYQIMKETTTAYCVGFVSDGLCEHIARFNREDLAQEYCKLKATIDRVTKEIMALKAQLNKKMHS